MERCSERFCHDGEGSPCLWKRTTINWALSYGVAWGSIALTHPWWCFARCPVACQRNWFPECLFLLRSKRRKWHIPRLCCLLDCHLTRKLWLNSTLFASLLVMQSDLYSSSKLISSVWLHPRWAFPHLLGPVDQDGFRTSQRPSELTSMFAPLQSWVKSPLRAELKEFVLNT